jgi:hypothetical protein
MNWWNNNENSNDNQSFTVANDHIRHCSPNTQLLLSYTELLQEVKEFRRLLSSCEDELIKNASDTQPSSSLVPEVLAEAIRLTNVTRKCGLDWKMIVLSAIHKKLLDLLYTSEDVHVIEGREHFEQSWLEPFEEQLTTLKTIEYIAAFF